MARILLVEDEPLLRELADEDLSDAGYDVTAARDGEEAVRILHQDCTFEALFTDIKMPGSVDGWQLAEEAKRCNPAIKIIYATGFAEGPRECAAHERHLQKPYRFENVLELLGELGVQP